jgi:GAF domain-containing protein
MSAVFSVMNMIAQPEAHLAALMEAEVAALRALDGQATLGEVLSDLMRAVEAEAEVEMLASVLLLSEDGKHLLEGAAPNLPAEYNAAIDGVEIGPSQGSCGTAAFYGEPVFVNDIKIDPLWSDFRDLALAHNLRACWSLPIKDETGKVLGTFANYYRQPRHPRPHDYAAIRQAANTVRQAIEKDRARQTLGSGPA